MQPRPNPLARVRWGNVARVLGLVTLAVLVGAWPRLRGEGPRLPPEAAEPVVVGPAVPASTTPGRDEDEAQREADLRATRDDERRARARERRRRAAARRRADRRRAAKRRAAARRAKEDVPPPSSAAPAVPAPPPSRPAPPPGARGEFGF